MHDFRERVGTGFLFFRWRESDIRPCSMLLVQRKDLFGVGWRLRVGRAQTGGSVVWRLTPIQSKGAGLGGKKRLQLSLSERHFFRGGVKEPVAIGGGVALLAQAPGNVNQPVFEQNPVVLFDGCPAKLKLFGN